MSSAISATVAATPVPRVTSATSADSNAAKIAAMQKTFVSLQKQAGARRPDKKTAAQQEQAEAEREASAKARAIEDGSSIGTNVDTYA